MTGHELAMTRFSQYWRRAVRSGYAYAEVSTRFRSTDLPLWDKEARSNLVHGAGLLAMVVVAPLISQALHSMIPNRSGGCDHRGARDSHGRPISVEDGRSGYPASVRSAFAARSHTSSVRSAQISARSFYRQNYETHRVQGKSCPTADSVRRSTARPA